MNDGILWVLLQHNLNGTVSSLRWFLYQTHPCQCPSTQFYFNILKRYHNEIGISFRRDLKIRGKTKMRETIICVS